MLKTFVTTYILCSLALGGWRASDLASGWEAKTFDKPQLETTNIVIASIGHGLAWGLPLTLIAYLFIAEKEK
jgi:hypothetical protein